MGLADVSAASDYRDMNDTESRVRQQTKEWLSKLSADRRGAILQEAEAVRRSFEERLKALEGAAAEPEDELNRLASRVDSLADDLVKEALASARQQMDAAAQEELTKVRSTLTGELEAARRESDDLRSLLGNQLAETERDISAIQQDRDEHAANLGQARVWIAALEETAEKARLDRQVAAACLEEEIQRRIAVEKQLDASRQELLLAKAEVDARRLEAQVAGERVRTLERTAAAGTPVHQLLAHLQRALDTLSRAPREQLLAALVDQLNGEFVSVGVFAASSDGFRLWKTSADESAARFPAHLSSAEGALLARAASERMAVRTDGSTSAPTLGLSKKPIAHAIALPILAQQRVLAVVYAENPLDQPCRNDHLLVEAEILVQCVNRRLGQPAGVAEREQPAQAPRVSPREQVQADEPDGATAVAEFGASAAATADSAGEFAVSRQAPRLKLSDEVQLLIDGVSSILVDVSPLGAQVLSPTTLRPNRVVRLLLPNGGGSLTCTARIVWAQLESPNSNTPVRYRSGIMFVDIQPTAIESFISRHRLPRSPVSDEPLRLMN